MLVVVLEVELLAEQVEVAAAPMEEVVDQDLMQYSRPEEAAVVVDMDIMVATVVPVS